MTTTLRITNPVHGDILNRHDGTARAEGLVVAIEGSCPAEAGVSVSVEGAPGVNQQARSRVQVDATVRGDCFEAQVPLQDRHNRITARGAGQQASIEVLWDRDSYPRCRFSIDDNILFLKDLARGDYTSVFDHWYLAFWKSLHERYGAKFHFNIYYQTDASVFGGRPFRLPEMPDRFRAEWTANADWLRLTFHAWQNKPDHPYQSSTYEQMTHDYEWVTQEIERFAGPDLISSFTTVHWADASRESVRALRDRGVTGLKGRFARNRGRVPETRYYLDEALADHIGGRDYWWDPSIDMRFVACEAVVNNLAVSEVVPRLEQVSANPHTGEVIELTIHEQYFRPELSLYQADVQQKVIAAISWLSEHGYAPVFWDEGFLGA
ncbi:MAG: hypothetical protein HPY83_18275 [Anaerolineae bacterium]|nr:hypothetical protein [Anaerolineae bacterium]NPV09894.1 hypothetical protein [Anaerolineae bacterium]